MQQKIVSPFQYYQGTGDDIGGGPESLPKKNKAKKRKSFMKLLKAKWDSGKMICVGLDPDIEKMPLNMRDGDHVYHIRKFLYAIVDATHDLVCAYKPNTAFYEAYGDNGIDMLRDVISYIGKVAPSVPVILDAKRGDIGNTNIGYAKFAFEYLCADAITVSPYMGHVAMKPFLDYKDKGIVVLCRTSNDGAGEFQDLPIMVGPSHMKMLYEVVAENVADKNKWNYNSNCLIVVGATRPAELKMVRQIVGSMPILVPGVGTQGGKIADVLQNGLASKRNGLVINVAREVLYASNGTDFAQKARAKVESMNLEIGEWIWSH